MKWKRWKVRRKSVDEAIKESRMIRLMYADSWKFSRKFKLNEDEIYLFAVLLYSTIFFGGRSLIT